MRSFPPSIELLINRLVHQEKYGTVINKKNVYFDFFSLAPVPPHVPQAAADVVRFLWPYRKCREHSFTAEFFFCDAPKLLPEKGVTLEEDHINTGYSEPCESLVVFRKQEWFKVFIHECFHYLGLDKGLAETVELNMFTLPIPISIRESYCEVWARLLQCKFLGGLMR